MYKEKRPVWLMIVLAGKSTQNGAGIWREPLGFLTTTEKQKGKQADACELAKQPAL
jgi:hypothetical protein